MIITRVELGYLARDNNPDGGRVEESNGIGAIGSRLLLNEQVRYTTA